MDFTESEAETAFRAKLRAWLADNIPEWWQSCERLKPIDRELLRSWSRMLYEAGWIGLTWPAAYGGRGLPESYQNIFLQEMSRTDAPDHMGAVGIAFAGPTILHWGTEEQKQAYLPAILRADQLWCQGFSEPGAGSDLASVRTRAVLSGEEWVVNGQKVWSTDAQYADRCILVVRTEPEAAKHAGLSFLLVDMHSPGVDVRPLTQITGVAEFNEIFFDDVRVPMQNILGERGEGWRVAMTTLTHERANAAVGLSLLLETQLNAFLELVVANGIGDTERVRIGLARAWTRLQAIRLNNYRLLSQHRAGGLPGPEAAVGKIAWSEAAQELTTLALEVQGMHGVLDGVDAPGDGYWQEQRLRARGYTIEEGTSEILKNVIAERVLQLPRSR